MNDPYSVLGVSPTASDEEVKKAYRDLVRKYHPDNYQGNPLADLAQEKMKEINEAYDAIMRQRSSGGGTDAGGGPGYSGSAGGYGGSGYAGTDAAAFARVRTVINSGNFAYAEELLRNIPNRNAEWHFLMGAVLYQKGWLDEALSHFQTAVQMDPANPEYRNALNRYRHATYNPYAQPARGGCCDNVTACDICTALVCADCLCDCF